MCILSFAEHRVRRQLLTDVRDIERHEASSSAKSHNRPSKEKEDIQHPLPDDVLQALRDNDELLKVYRKNWQRIKDCTKKGKVRSTYNLRLKDISAESLDSMLEQVFEDQTHAFKINASYGFILRNNETNELRHFYSSTNNRVFSEPVLVKDRQGLQSFTNTFNLQDPLEYARLQRPNSKWVVDLITNVTFFVYKLPDHIIGTPTTNLPEFVKENQAIVCLEKNPNSRKPYRDNLCFFRCLALHKGHHRNALETTAISLFGQYTKEPYF